MISYVCQILNQMMNGLQKKKILVCLLISHGWNIHECFDDEEGAPNKKRKRGNYFYSQVEI